MVKKVTDACDKIEVAIPSAKLQFWSVVGNGTNYRERERELTTREGLKKN